MTVDKVKIAKEIELLLLEKLRLGAVCPSKLKQNTCKEFILSLILLEEEFPLGFHYFKQKFDEEEIKSILFNCSRSKSFKNKEEFTLSVFNKLYIHIRLQVKKEDSIQAYILSKTPFEEEIVYIPERNPFISFRLNFNFILKGRSNKPFSELRLLDRLSMYNAFLDQNPDKVPTLFSDHISNHTDNKEKERRNYSKSLITNRLRDLKSSTLH